MMADENFDHYDEMIADIDKKVSQLVRKTLFDAQAIAQQESRTDTSAMKNAWFVNTEDYSNRKVPSKIPEGSFVFPPRAKAAHNEGELAGGMSYTIYNELGTVHMPAKPMAAPAINRVRKPFLQALERVANGGK